MMKTGLSDLTKLTAHIKDTFTAAVGTYRALLAALPKWCENASAALTARRAPCRRRVRRRRRRDGGGGVMMTPCSPESSSTR